MRTVRQIPRANALGIWLPVSHAPSCIVITNPSRTGLNPLIRLVHWLIVEYMVTWEHVWNSVSAIPLILQSTLTFIHYYQSELTENDFNSIQTQNIYRKFNHDMYFLTILAKSHHNTFLVVMYACVWRAHVIRSGARLGFPIFLKLHIIADNDISTKGTPGISLHGETYRHASPHRGPVIGSSDVFCC